MAMSRDEIVGSTKCAVYKCAIARCSVNNTRQMATSSENLALKRKFENAVGLLAMPKASTMRFA